MASGSSKKDLNDYRDLKGKVAILTGSTTGIGLEIAKRLAAEGAHVVVSSRQQDNVDKAVKELKDCGYSVLGVPCHVSNENDRKNLIDKTIETFGGIDILVSSAAVNPTLNGNMISILECTDSIWDKIFEVNVKNSYQIARMVIPHMKKRKGGSIVFIGSVTGYAPWLECGAYNVSKTAVLGLTKTFSQVLAPENIRVNCVAPGIVQTEFARNLSALPSVKAGLPFLIPMGRPGTPDEVCGAVAFLCSNDARYVTGETITVSGGMTSRL